MKGEGRLLGVRREGSQWEPEGRGKTPGGEEGGESVGI